MEASPTRPTSRPRRTDEELHRIGEAEDLQLASDLERDVTFAEAALDAHAAVNAAYHTEHDRGPRFVGSVVGSEAQAVTIRVAPRAS